MQIPGNFIPKRKRPVPDGGWRLTLADMMTLILCFFVVMLSVSKVDPNRYEAMSGVLAEAMKGKAAPSNRPDQQPMSQEEKKSKNLFELELELAKLIGRESRAVNLKLRPDAVAINLKGGVFFPLGSADLTPEAVDILNKLARPLTDAHYKLTVEGHSDNLPIKSSQFPSNWELSSARASSVARFFIAQGFPKNDIQVMGLADTRPLAPNTDKAGNSIPDNQSMNRRVVILVRPAS
ncbi:MULTISPECIES: flagellar motor protein MotB [unclassified Pseudodesulfovibrio]|uniref:OmpA/MotB family protein n=1 Tax=unclassified Pseudodesulfovibrio TaxID=2661612 RepID=UPI000FEBEFC9|nr:MULTISPECIES: flagellar motor protein MotB [unclassified Pseudodesulfovibrio]MCJ2165839.1 flagellar motor protein MotB [Pseudodesulfovibrio sp. S3-i]RWU02725.1 flagellar motor protein MotB [Pseudodesulfovibrio sp. S3]